MTPLTRISLASALAGSASVFGQSAWLPEAGQFVAMPGFTYSTFDKFWMGSTKMDNLSTPPGKSLDQYIGYVALEYGITENLATDLSLGYTATDSDAFGSDSDSGLADTTLGVRYRLVDENNPPVAWLPTITVRGGIVIPGTYDEDFPFSGGDGVYGIEGSFLFAREICNGFGAFGDVGYRWREEESSSGVIV